MFVSEYFLLGIGPPLEPIEPKEDPGAVEA